MLSTDKYDSNSFLFDIKRRLLENDNHYNGLSEKQYQAVMRVLDSFDDSRRRKIYVEKLEKNESLTPSLKKTLIALIKYPFLTRGGDAGYTARICSNLIKCVKPENVVLNRKLQSSVYEYMRAQNTLKFGVLPQISDYQKWS